MRTYQIYISFTCITGTLGVVTQVGQWMVGVKRLIQEAREVEAPISPTDTTVSSHPEAPLAVTSPVPSVETTAQIPDKIGHETTACAPVLDAPTTSNLNDSKDLHPEAIVDDKQCSVESATTQQVSLEPGQVSHDAGDKT